MGLFTGTCVAAKRHASGVQPDASCGVPACINILVSGYTLDQGCIFYNVPGFLQIPHFHRFRLCRLYLKILFVDNTGLVSASLCSTLNSLFLNILRL